MPRKPPPDPPAPAATKAKPKATASPGRRQAIADPGRPPAEIDRIDKELVELLNRRSEVAVQIGQIKQAQGLDIWSPSREEEVVARAIAASRGPCPTRPSGSSSAS